MLPPKLMTAVVLLVVVVALFVYDSYVIMCAYPEATLSEVIMAVAQEQPILPFLAGVLVGHLFWPQIGQPKLPVPPVAKVGGW